MRKTKEDRRERVLAWAQYYRRHHPRYSDEQIYKMANLHPWLPIPDDGQDIHKSVDSPGKEATTFRCPHCGEIIALRVE